MILKQKSFKNISAALLKFLSQIMVETRNGEKPIQIIWKPKFRRSVAGNSLSVSNYTPWVPVVVVEPQGFVRDMNRMCQPIYEIDLLFGAIKPDKIELAKPFLSLINPKPVNFTYKCTIYSNTAEQLSLFAEWIIVNFSPNNTTLAIREYSWLNKQMNINMKVTDITFDFNGYNQEVAKLGLSTAEFTVTCEGFVYPDIRIDLAEGDFIEDIFIETHLAKDDDFANIIHGLPSVSMTSAMPTTGLINSTQLPGVSIHDIGAQHIFAPMNFPN